MKKNTILLILSLCLYCADESNGDEAATAKSKISGTVTTAANVTNRCYWVQIDTDINGANGNVALATGFVTGSSFNYELTGIDSGNYYISAFVDLDSNCSAAPTSGDHLGWAGSASVNAPAGAIVNVNAPTNYTYNLQLYVFP